MTGFKIYKMSRHAAWIAKAREMRLGSNKKAAAEYLSLAAMTRKSIATGAAA